jgi:hypothetical protein
MAPSINVAKQAAATLAKLGINKPIAPASSATPITTRNHWPVPKASTVATGNGSARNLRLAVNVKTAARIICSDHASDSPHFGCMEPERSNIRKTIGMLRISKF